METPDGPEGLTVVFNLETPNVAFADYLAGSSGYIESPTAAAAGYNFKTDGVGTGPFKFVRVHRRRAHRPREVGQVLAEGRERHPAARTSTSSRWCRSPTPASA